MVPMTAPVHKSVKDQSDEGAYVAPRPAPPVELTRRPVRNTGRKHPPYGAILAESPLPSDETLRVCIGWQYEEWVSERRVIVAATDDPAALRFDAAAGRRVRVIHPHDASPEHLFRLAQTLVDYGAVSVELAIFPLRPGTHCTEVLRIVPKGAQ